VLGVVENMSGLRHRLGDFRFLRRDGDGGAEADVTATVLQRIREVAPELEVRSGFETSLVAIAASELHEG